MALPPSFETIHCSADADGWVFKEDWSSVGLPPDKTRWNVCPSWWWNGDESINGGAAAFDAGMGENRVTFTQGRTFPRFFFDHTKPARWEYRLRCRDAGSWSAFGVLFSGEPSYAGGVTCELNNVYDIDGETLLGHQVGMYGWTFPGFPEVNGSTYVPKGSVFDIEMEWTPGNSAVRNCRARVCSVTNGVRGTWSGWRTLYRNEGGTVPAHGWLQAVLSFPATIYFVATDWDIGHFYSAHAPVWGASDFFGWDTWRKSATCAVAEGTDTASVLGGLCSRPSALAAGSDYVPLIQTAPWIGDGTPEACAAQRISRIGYPVTQDFDAQSPAVIPEVGYRYRTLKFRAYHANDNLIGPTRFPEGNLRIYVCDAYTGDLLPDSMVPGNSVGLCSVAPTVPASTLADPGPVNINPYRDTTYWEYNTDPTRPIHTATNDVGWHSYTEMPGTQVVSLEGVPPDRHIFLDVQGHCDAGMPCRMDGLEPLPWESTPRLGGVWIDFQPITLTASIKSRVDATAVLGGYRKPGTTITVT